MRDKNSLVATEADIHTLSLPHLSFIDFGNEDEQNVDNFEMKEIILPIFIITRTIILTWLVFKVNRGQLNPLPTYPEEVGSSFRPLSIVPGTSFKSSVSQITGTLLQSLKTGEECRREIK